MARKRVLTENIGCFLSKQDADTVKAYAKAQRMTVSDYLRQAAVRPLLVVAAEVEVDGEQN
jgi:hypothetical protein